MNKLLKIFLIAGVLLPAFCFAGSDDEVEIRPRGKVSNRARAGSNARYSGMEDVDPRTVQEEADRLRESGQNPFSPSGSPSASAITPLSLEAKKSSSSPSSQRSPRKKSSRRHRHRGHKSRSSVSSSDEAMFKEFVTIFYSLYQSFESAIGKNTAYIMSLIFLASLIIDTDFVSSEFKQVYGYGQKLFGSFGSKFSGGLSILKADLSPLVSYCKSHPIKATLWLLVVYESFSKVNGQVAPSQMTKDFLRPYIMPYYNNLVNFSRHVSSSE